jgi:hypothetical protein
MSCLVVLKRRIENAVRRWLAPGPAIAVPSQNASDFNEEINAALADPKIKAQLADFGNVPLALSPADFGKLC